HYYGWYIRSTDQFRRCRSTWRSTSPAALAEGLSGGEWQTCFRLSWRWQRFRCDAPRRARSRRAGGKRLHQAEQADLSRIRGLGKEECQVAKTRRDREAQRGGARLQS